MSALFAHYPVTPGAVRAAADRVRASGGPVLGAATAAAAAATRAKGNVWGLLLGPVAALPDPLVRRGAEIADAADFCAGAVTVFAGAVATFDTTVDSLNREWEQAAGSSFGQSEPMMRGGMTPEVMQRAWDGWEERVAAARAALLLRLRSDHAAAEAELDSVATTVAGMLGRGPNDADKQQINSLTGGDGSAPGAPGGPHYVVGPRTVPPFHYDDDFPFDPDASAGFGDYKAWLEWQAKLSGGRIARPDLDDALALYAHYRDATGTPMTVDYEEGYREDPQIRAAIDAEIANASRAVDVLARQNRLSEFSVTGDAASSSELAGYPTTENWQKTLGAHNVWSNANVRINGDQVTMDITVNADDRYNFNRGDSDIATGTPDEANGRFAELGWAKQFDVHGEVHRTITWTLGQPIPTIATDQGHTNRSPGGEDRTDGRDSSDTNWPR